MTVVQFGSQPESKAQTEEKLRSEWIDAINERDRLKSEAERADQRAKELIKKLNELQLPSGTVVVLTEMAEEAPVKAVTVQKGASGYVTGEDGDYRWVRVNTHSVTGWTVRGTGTEHVAAPVYQEVRIHRSKLRMKDTGAR